MTSLSGTDSQLGCNKPRTSLSTYITVIPTTTMINSSVALRRHGVRRCAIHVFPLIRAAKTWMAGASPAMTMRADCAGGRSFIVAVGITYVSQEAEYVPAKNRRMPVWRDPLRNCRRPRLHPALPLSRLPAAKRRGAYPRCARAQRAGPHPSGHAQAIRHVFCGDCGTPLYVQVATRPDLVGLRVCTLDDPTLVPA